jgi:hypothetical protein
VKNPAHPAIERAMLIALSKRRRSFEPRNAPDPAPIARAFVHRNTSHLLPHGRGPQQRGLPINTGTAADPGDLSPSMDKPVGKI